MTLSNVLPVLFVFLVWGVKPGPHTMTLLLKTAQSGVRPALLIAIGNNLTHLGFFWVSVFALTFISPGPTFVFWMQLLAGFLIIAMSIAEARGGENQTARTKTVSLLTGFAVGMSNPLNVSFYLGVMPKILVHDYSWADIAVMSFLVFWALLAGQLLYIAFADMVRFAFDKTETRVLIWRVSNILFSFVGVYFILSAFDVL